MMGSTCNSHSGLLNPGPARLWPGISRHHTTTNGTYCAHGSEPVRALAADTQGGARKGGLPTRKGGASAREIEAPAHVEGGMVDVGFGATLRRLFGKDLSSRPRRPCGAALVVSEDGHGDRLLPCTGRRNQRRGPETCPTILTKRTRELPRRAKGRTSAERGTRAAGARALPRTFQVRRNTVQ